MYLYQYNLHPYIKWPGLNGAGHPGDEHEDRFYNRTVLAWFHLFDVRAQRVPSLYSHAAAYGRCSAVLRSPLRVPVLRGDFSVADSTRGPVACESLRAFGTDDSGGRDCQHTLLSHFHGACGFAAGCGRYCLVVSYDLEGAVRVYRDPSTLTRQRQPGRSTMPNRLSGKVCIITGTGGGMGREAALTFAREGALVVGCGLYVDDAEATVVAVRELQQFRQAQIRRADTIKPD